MNPLSIAGAVGSGIGSLFNIFQGAKMIKEAKKINPVYNPYQESQAVKNVYGQAQAEMFAPDAGTAGQMRALQGSQANAYGNIKRGVVDPSMAIATFAAGQESMDQGIDKMFMRQSENRQAKFSNLMNTANMMGNESKFKFQADLGKYDRDMSQKNALRSAGQQTIAGGISGLAGTFLGLGAQRDANDRSLMNLYSSMIS